MKTITISFITGVVVFVLTLSLVKVYNVLYPPFRHKCPRTFVSNQKRKPWELIGYSKASPFYKIASPYSGKFLTSSGKMINSQEEATLFSINYKDNAKLSPNILISGKEYEVNIQEDILIVREGGMAIEVDKDDVQLVTLSLVPWLKCPAFTVMPFNSGTIKWV